MKNIFHVVVVVILLLFFYTSKANFGVDDKNEIISNGESYYFLLREAETSSLSIAPNELSGYKLLEYFRCISYNWNKIHCLLKPLNKIFKLYKIVEVYDTSYINLEKCVEKVTDDEYIVNIFIKPNYPSTVDNSCFYTPRPTQYFLIKSDRHDEIIEFNSSKIVILNPPMDFTAVRIYNDINKEHQASLFWKQPFVLPSYEGEIQFDISYMEDGYFSSNWIEYKIISGQTTSENWQINFRPHTHELSQVRIRCKLSVNTEDDMWSDYTYAKWNKSEVTFIDFT